MEHKVKIPNRSYTNREKTVVEILKQVEGIKSFINFGFHNWEDNRRHWWIDICKVNDVDWEIIEIFEQNVINAVNAGCPENKIKIGNILETDSYENSDCILFWHGPEHIERETFLENIKRIESKATKIIIFGMPYGEEAQGPVYGNKYEEHVSAWYEEDFEKMGYQCIVLHDGKGSGRAGHMTVYKVLGE